MKMAHRNSWFTMIYLLKMVIFQFANCKRLPEATSASSSAPWCGPSTSGSPPAKPDPVFLVFCPCQNKNVIQNVHVRENKKSTSYSILILYIIDHYRILMHIGLNWPYMFCFIQSCWHCPCKTRPWNSRNVNQKGASAGSPKGRIQVHYMGRSTYVYYILYTCIYIYVWYIILYI